MGDVQGPRSVLNSLHKLDISYSSKSSSDGDDSSPSPAPEAGETTQQQQQQQRGKSRQDRHPRAMGDRKHGSRKSQMSKSLQSAQERLAELLVPGKDTLLLHEETSYHLLGKADDAPKVVAGASARAQEISPRRIHPHRLFYPGAKYSPEELNPYKAKEVLMRSDLTVRRGTIPASVVKDQADFRNTDFLAYFLKDSGKLVPRRRTKLPAKLHRELMREIKLSRSLALMNPLNKNTVSKIS